MKLWLVRHAQVNVPAGLCYGATDVAADAAATEAAAIAFATQPSQGSLLWASPLARARLLAQALREQRPDLPETIFDARLQEMNFGQWEMQAWDDIPRSAVDAWVADFPHHRFGGEESTQVVIHRVADALHDLRQLGKKEAVWITHAGVIRAVRFLLQGSQRIIQSAEQWPQAAPAMGEWVAYDV